ncbi:MAG: hypothetical protein A3I11_02360 [Elusimicrobia bacterium RIFCSPLOWO2_02_FULL_39_32]|nr:MAG: hypothetical protein A2034_03710 [Elusimicrobia bacterium GWA2_38_7]OGR78461.1 MAG: hypothetical protein A3B80_07245 [Elusimicrobia bacterium RIFCSPHIGHO2_02_FULL_39_36]OGR92220.1 MAG: hypothetical protein A3I11_02360 [Elusimicrobia bacterium RIFCSPLOWO2_02_FULL_39_32]OGR99913.1 MAG: hypothetical protein A3G85_03080 [Elusimicrobia bacterium RIFCSPLOWO2_12_FULL_39_28]
MNKIRIVHHSNQLGLGGTEKEMQLLCKYLNKDLFEIYALAPYYPVPLHRLFSDHVKAFFGSKAALARKQQNHYLHARVPEFIKVLGEERVILYTDFTLAKIMRKISPHILHVHHSGLMSRPFNHPKVIDQIPLLFTINVFGFRDESYFQYKLNKILFPSYWLKEATQSWSKEDPRCDVLYCPVEKPQTKENLRKELKIEKDCFVLGRIGRNADDIYDPISLGAYKQIETDQTLFLVLSAPPKMKEDSKKMGIRRILFLEPEISDLFLSKFYNTIDVLAHARLDGETFGCVIAEAMIHGKPVVSHFSHIRNAQAELLTKECGFVAPQNDWKKYAEVLKLLCEKKFLRLEMGECARQRAEENFEASLIAKRLESFYLQELKKKNLIS